MQMPKKEELRKAYEVVCVLCFALSEEALRETFLEGIAIPAFFFGCVVHGILSYTRSTHSGKPDTTVTIWYLLTNFYWMYVIYHIAHYNVSKAATFFGITCTTLYYVFAWLTRKRDAN